MYKPAECELYFYTETICCINIAETASNGSSLTGGSGPIRLLYSNRYSRVTGRLAQRLALLWQADLSSAIAMQCRYSTEAFRMVAPVIPYLSVIITRKDTEDIRRVYIHRLHTENRHPTGNHCAEVSR